MVICRKLLQNCVLRKMKKDSANAESIFCGSWSSNRSLLQTVPGTVRVFYGESSSISL